MILRLLVRVGLFILPFVLLVAPVFALAFYSGEAMPVRWVLDIQRDNPDAIYRQWDMSFNRAYTYKLTAYEMHATHNILMLGSSRVLAFESDLAVDPGSFYNFGMPSVYMDEAFSILDAFTPETSPDVLVIGVDLFWFNGTLAPVKDKPRALEYDDIKWGETLLSGRVIVQQLLSGARKLDSLVSRQNPRGEGIALGLEALATGVGYKWDGSLLSSRDFQRIVEGDPAENYAKRPTTAGGDIVMIENFAKLARFLERAEALDIHVVGFLPPYTTELYSFIQTGGNHGYFETARTEVKAVFAEHGVHLFDFSDITTMGIGSEEMSDFVHPSPALAARMFSIMASNVPELGRYAASTEFDAP